MESVWSVSKLSTESVGSRRELVVNCVHTDDANMTKTVSSRQWCVLGISNKLLSSSYIIGLTNVFHNY